MSPVFSSNSSTLAFQSSSVWFWLASWLTRHTTAATPVSAIFFTKTAWSSIAPPKVPVATTCTHPFARLTTRLAKARRSSTVSSRISLDPQPANSPATPDAMYQLVIRSTPSQSICLLGVNAVSITGHTPLARSQVAFMSFSLRKSD